MKKLLVMLTCILVLMSGGRLFAQQSATSHDQAVAVLFQVMGIDRQVRVVAETMSDTMIKSNPMMLPYRDVILEWFQKYFTWDTLGVEFAKLYKDTFTESEIREMTAFYKTPIGQKVLTKLPELTQKQMAIGSAIGQAHSRELQDMIQAKAKELEATKKKP